MCRRNDRGGKKAIEDDLQFGAQNLSAAQHCAAVKPGELDAQGHIVTVHRVQATPASVTTPARDLFGQIPRSTRI